MAERQGLDQQPQQQQLDPPQLRSPSQEQQPSAKEDMFGCVMALEASLLPCLPARELQAIDRSPHPSHQIDVERHARDFMEAAKKLQLYFIGLQRHGRPTAIETLKEEIAVMEEELEKMDEMVKKQERSIQGWTKELTDQLDKQKTELQRV
ncbi:hypothetical protein K2173_001135 [Erythroxylum novogranatense]|uniref:Mediator of RNA polymerase II transcription subunit 28 n=1 Tax=Erythroxylum novogranatense TaxID=1862640 RepID=A0AAV8TIE5_9ROSI|nr:hypothetical protein K2173_001135 [Erythroxylum novogranatense]